MTRVAAATSRSRCRCARATRWASSRAPSTSMLEGLRQRDFIRNAFGRYVSPEVAKTLLESPDGPALRRREARGHRAHVRPARLHALRRARRSRRGHGGAQRLPGADGRHHHRARRHHQRVHRRCHLRGVRGAARACRPRGAGGRDRAGHAAGEWRRSTATNAARGRPHFEMGIGVHTGEAVVGNIGSEQRAKYAVVGAAVNLAARVEGATVGGQVFVTAATAERADPRAGRGRAADLRRAQGPDERPRPLRAAGHPRPLRPAPGRRRRRTASVEVDLSAGRCKVIEGKRGPTPTPSTGTVRRLARRSARGAAERRAGRADQRPDAR